MKQLQNIVDALRIINRTIAELPTVEIACKAYSGIQHRITDITYDHDHPETGKCYVVCDGEKIEITNKEQQQLQHLVGNDDTILAIAEQIKASKQ